MAKASGRKPTAAQSENRLGTISPGAGLDEDGKHTSRDFVGSLSRGLEILRAFSRTRRKMTLSEVAAETDMSRATARRFLLTLLKEGYVSTDGKLFDLTPKVLDLGFSVLSTIGIWDRARPFMDRLSEETGESCTAAILDGLEVIYVAGVQAHNIISVGITLGSRQSALYTANGRVLLAEQPDEYLDQVIKTAQLVPRTPHSVTNRARLREILMGVREQGWCLVDQELEMGLLSVAIPLRYRSGEMAGSINIAVPTVRATPDDMVNVFLPKLRETAEEIRNSLAR